MKTSLSVLTVIFLMLVIGILCAATSQPDKASTKELTVAITDKAAGSQPAEHEVGKLGMPVVSALVKALSDPSNDVRAKAAEALRPILAADPSLAPNWHDRTFWTKRIEKTKPNMLLKDALAILLPEMSAEERAQTCTGSDWSGGTGDSIYQLDDYWRVVIYLNTLGEEKLIKAPELQQFVREQGVKPAGDFTGLWVTWHVNGQKAYEIQYRNGKHDGMFTSYWDNGSKCYQQHVKGGIADGPDTGWYKSGKKMYEGQYKDDQQDGTWRHWYENGQLSLEATYKNGTQVSSQSWPENDLSPAASQPASTPSKIGG
ncbi:MAG: hypothetical protein WCI73_05400 [Phycisphaerae bacterium]